MGDSERTSFRTKALGGLQWWAWLTLFKRVTAADTTDTWKGFSFPFGNGALSEYMFMTTSDTQWPTLRLPNKQPLSDSHLIQILIGDPMTFVIRGNPERGKVSMLNPAGGGGTNVLDSEFTFPAHLDRPPECGREELFRYVRKSLPAYTASLVQERPRFHELIEQASALALDPEYNAIIKEAARAPRADLVPLKERWKARVGELCGGAAREGLAGGRGATAAVAGGIDVGSVGAAVAPAAEGARTAEVGGVQAADPQSAAAADPAADPAAGGGIRREPSSRVLTPAADLPAAGGNPPATSS